MRPNNSSQAGNTTRRRNGKQQACEPCSRRKVACDHRLPVCSRCMRGRNPDKCVYLPERRTDRSTVSTQPSRLALQQSPPESRDTSASPLNPVRRPDEVPGFLGATNYSAVFRENEARLPSFRNLDLPSEGGQAVQESPAALDKETLETAMDVLRNIPDRNSAFVLFKKTYLSNGWSAFAAERLWDSLWEDFHDVLEGSRDDQSLSSFAEKLSRNTSQPWAEDESDPEEWLAAFSGRNYRWESLGVLFVYFGYGASSFPNDTSLEQSVSFRPASRHKLKLDYKRCARKCIQLARHFHSCNTVVLWAMIKHCLLESIVSGDGSTLTSVDLAQRSLC